jgi:hypothetical protein
MAVLKAFKSFNVEGATVTLWLFRKTQRPVGQPPGYVGRWVDTHEELEAKLKEAVIAERDRITETQDYSRLAQNNEGSALAIDALVTNAGLITHQAAAEVSARRVKTMKEIQSTNFYAIKLTSSGKNMYAVRKAEASWQIKKMKDVIYAFFSGNKLALDDKPSFRISPSVDFFIIEDQVLISHKIHFESILSYKEAHLDDFGKLQEDQAFQTLFTTVDPLVSFVGSNKIHLRRACAIHDMGHYKNKKFMSRLRKDHAKYQLKLKFDAQGRIVPTEETCADIIRALLDHRLLSPFSEHLYDVQDAAVVS